MARFDFAFDAVQTEFMALTGADTSRLGAIDGRQRGAIEQAGVIQHSYTAPGTITPSSRARVLRDGVNDVPLVDWVTAMIAGENVTDVTCAECRQQTG